MPDRHYRDSFYELVNDSNGTNDTNDIRGSDRLRTPCVVYLMDGRYGVYANGRVVTRGLLTYIEAQVAAAVSAWSLRGPYR
jgi:hypothetical protein